MAEQNAECRLCAVAGQQKRAHRSRRIPTGAKKYTNFHFYSYSSDRLSIVRFFSRFTMNLPAVVGLFVKSVLYLFFAQCVLLGPAYAVTLLCFVVYTVAEYIRKLLKLLINKASGRKLARPKRTVLINGCTQSASLHIARGLYSAGFRVIACDLPQHWLNPTRFSVAVDEYYTLPKPELGVQEYVRMLCEIAKKEKVEAFIPISTAEGVIFDSLAKPQLERQGCACLISSAEHVRRLSSKVTFFQHAAKCGFSVPLHFKVTSVSEIMELYENGTITKHKPFVLTSMRCYNKYIQDSVLMPSSIEEFMANIGEYDGYSCAILIQQCIPGQTFTTSTTIHESNIISHSSCYTVSPYLFDPVQSANSLAWIQTFVKMYPTKLTGNFIFNFVVGKDDRKLYPESCLAGVGFCVTNAPLAALGSSILADIPLKVPLQPKDPQTVYWLYEELWNLIQGGVNVTQILNCFWKICFGKEADFLVWDPLPFIALNHLHLPFLVLINLLQRKGWANIDFPSGKLTS